ncbi:MAG: 50S ribosomal protein L6 [Phycisphaeraceae bacterium]|nr:50S ribosomal protein L6 [Phycisphaeraceae bacterium]
MSRIGKKPISLPDGVTVTLKERQIAVKGKLGELKFVHRPEVKVEVDQAARQVVVQCADASKEGNAYHGTTRALINNMVTGVSEGYKKELDVVGVGWTAQVQGGKVRLNVGYADTKEVTIPAGVTVTVAGPRVTVVGADKQAVGQTAAEIRAKRKPEPYNGKGIKYADEVIVRKQGKAFGSA